MENYFVIKGRLPGLNEVIGKNRSSKWSGSQIKHATDTAIAWQIKTQIGMGRCRKPSGPVRIRIEWHEATRRRDLDNIFKYVVGLRDDFYLDDDERIIVQIMEEDKNGQKLQTDK